MNIKRLLMKRVLLIIALAFFELGGRGQDTNINGTINFLTKVSNADPSLAIDVKFSEYHVRESAAVVWAGPAYKAQLYVGATADSLSPVGVVIPFLGSGYLNGGKVHTPLPQGSTGFVQLRAWEAAGGDTFEVARLRHKWISTVTIAVILGGDDLSPPVPPANLVGLEGTSIVVDDAVIPEPSSVLLFAVGIVWVTRWRRTSMGFCRRALR
jgi:hypothetical protein